VSGFGSQCFGPAEPSAVEFRQKCPAQLIVDFLSLLATNQGIAGKDRERGFALSQQDKATPIFN